MVDIARGLRWLAVVASATDQPRKAISLLGAAATLHPALGRYDWPENIALYETGLEAARTTLNPDEFATAWTEGQAMSLARAVDYALTCEA